MVDFHSLGGGPDQTAKSHHCPRCERHRARQTARGDAQQHQKTVSPGPSVPFPLDVFVCGAKTVLMLDVSSGCDEVDPPVRTEDPGEPSAGSRALLRWGDDTLSKNVPPASKSNPIRLKDNTPLVLSSRFSPESAHHDAQCWCHQPRQQPLHCGCPACVWRCAHQCIQPGAQPCPPCHR